MTLTLFIPIWFLKVITLTLISGVVFICGIFLYALLNDWR